MNVYLIEDEVGVKHVGAETPIEALEKWGSVIGNKYPRDDKPDFLAMRVLSKGENQLIL